MTEEKLFENMYSAVLKIWFVLLQETSRHDFDPFQLFFVAVDVKV